MPRLISIFAVYGSLGIVFSFIVGAILLNQSEFLQPSDERMQILYIRGKELFVSKELYYIYNINKIASIFFLFVSIIVGYGEKNKKQ